MATYLTLHHSTMAQLQSTKTQNSTSLYLTLLHSTMTLFHSQKQRSASFLGRELGYLIV